MSPFRLSFSPQPGVFSQRFDLSGQPRCVSHAVSCYCALLNSLAALFATPILCFQQLAHSFVTLGLSAGVDEDSPRRRCLYGTPLHTNSFASYHIPATPAVSCSCALFRATARSYPSYFQQLPHSFYRHGGGTPVTSVYPEPSKGAPISAPSVLRFFPFWFACAQAVAGPRMIAYEAC